MCINCNDPLQINLVPGPQGPQGPAGPAGQNGSNGSIGTTGAQGPEGPVGGVTFQYYFGGYGASNASSTTKVAISAADSITPNTSATVYVSNFAVPAVGVSNYMAVISGVTSKVKGYIKIFKKSDTSKYLIYQINSGTLSGTYYTFDCTLKVTNASNTDLTTNSDVYVSFVSNGDAAQNSIFTVGTPSGGPCPSGTFTNVSYTTANTDLTYTNASGTTLFAYSTTVKNTTDSVSMPTSIIDNAGVITIPSTGFYRFEIFGSLSNTTWANGSTAGAMVVYIMDTSNNLYLAQTVLTTGMAQKYVTFGATSGAVSLSQGTTLKARLINATGYSYANVATDGIKLTISKLS